MEVHKKIKELQRKPVLHNLILNMVLEYCGKPKIWFQYFKSKAAELRD